MSKWKIDQITMETHTRAPIQSWMHGNFHENSVLSQQRNYDEAEIWNIIINCQCVNTSEFNDMPFKIAFAILRRHLFLAFIRHLFVIHLVNRSGVVCCMCIIFNTNYSFFQWNAKSLFLFERSENKRGPNTAQTIPKKKNRDETTAKSGNAIAIRMNF